nr:MAG TPA: hypothetical protein [Caudoviricetes sp.]
MLLLVLLIDIFNLIRLHPPPKRWRTSGGLG